MHKYDQQAKMKLYEKFKNNSVVRIRATLTFPLFKVALNPLHRFFLIFADNFFAHQKTLAGSFVFHPELYVSA